MKKRMVFIFIIMFTFTVSLAAQSPELKDKSDNSRLALVIGNSDYRHPFGKLKYAKTDAENIRDALNDLKFKVTFVPDATKREFRRKLHKWGTTLKRSGGVALFYYVGHGFQHNGVNYLIPTDADISHGSEAVAQAITAQMVLGIMQEAECHTNIIVFDACRENILVETGIAKSGFADIPAWSGAVIAYSAISGRKAKDVQSYSSFFYYQLLRNPHLEIGEILKNVRQSVISNTRHSQLPYEINSLDHDFYFKVDNTPPAPLPGRRVKLRQKQLMLARDLVKEIILKYKFYELTWNSKKEFKSKFQTLKRKNRRGKSTTVIIDDVTGLMWLKGGSEPMAYKAACKWLKKLNKNERPAGFGNWRFPTIDEAASLLGAYEDNGLYIDPAFSSRQKMIWTCDSARQKPLEGEWLLLYWAVDFENGIVARFDEGDLLSLRPVRYMY